MHLIERLEELFKRRPHARVLILEARADDVPVTVEWLRRVGIYAGAGANDPVLVMECAAYGHHKGRLGIVDVAFVHNQHNMLRTDKRPNYKSIVKFLESQKNGVTWAIIEPESVLDLPDDVTRRGWTCGEPLELEGPPQHLELVAQRDVEWKPCGADNPQGAWYCRSCGLFRGISYSGR